MTVLNSFVLGRSPGSEQLSLGILGALTALALLHWLTAKQVWTQAVAKMPAQLYAVGYGFAAAIVIALMPVGYSAFIYFQF
jgi:hypothetical protein